MAHRQRIVEQLLDPHGDEVRQEIDAMDDNLRLGNTLLSIVTHFGHFRDPKINDPLSESQQYIPALTYEEAIVDLERLLVPDGKMPNEQVATRMIQMKILERHLIPLLITVPSTAKHLRPIMSIINMLVILTTPNLDWDTASDHLHHQRVLKRFIGHVRVQTTLVSILASALQGGSHSNRFVIDEVIDKVFTLVRNILVVPDSFDTGLNGQSFATGYDQCGKIQLVFAAMLEARLFEFLVVAAGNCRDDPFRKHVIVLAEIFELLFSNFAPEQVVDSIVKKAPSTKTILNDSLDDPKPKKPIRHSNFSGSIVVRLSTGEDYVLAQARNQSSQLNLDYAKNRRYRRQPFVYPDFGKKDGMWSSQELKHAYNCAHSLLQSGFNPLILRLSELIQRGSGEDGQKVGWCYVRLGSWFLAFMLQLQMQSLKPNNIPSYYGAPAKLSSIYGVLEVEALLFHARNLTSLMHQKRIHLLMATISFFLNLFRILEYLLNSTEPTEHDIATHLESNLFYRIDAMSQFRHALQFLKNPSIRILEILIETNHVLLKLLQRYCNGKRHVFVAKSMSKKKDRLPHPDTSDREDDSEEENLLVEREFAFDRFLGEYCNEGIINALIILLKQATHLSPKTNRYVAALMFRLFVECKAESLFYRVKLFDAIHRILRSDPPYRHRLVELSKVSILIAQGFLQRIKKNSLGYVEAWFGLVDTDRRSENTKGMDDRSIAHNVPLVEFPASIGRDQQIRILIGRLIEGEFSAVLNWLKGVLYDLAASRMNRSAVLMDTFEEIPNFDTDPSKDGNYPLHVETNSYKRAFSDSNFCTLLTLIGALPPNDHSTVWAIPESIGCDALLRTASLVQTSIHELIDDKESNPNKGSSRSIQGEQQTVLSDSEGGKEKGQKIILKRKPREQPRLKDKDNDRQRSKNNRKTLKKSDGDIKVTQKDNDTYSEMVLAAQLDHGQSATDLSGQSDDLGEEENANTVNEYDDTAPAKPAPNKWKLLREQHSFLRKPVPISIVEDDE